MADRWVESWIDSEWDDAKGLFKAAVRDDNPCVIFEHKISYRKVKGHVPEDDYVIPLGVADVKREGRDITIMAFLHHFKDLCAAMGRPELPTTPGWETDLQRLERKARAGMRTAAERPPRVDGDDHRGDDDA